MQAQTQMAKGELLYEIQGKTLSRTVKEITPHGVKLQMNDEGSSTGKLSAAQINTVDVFMKTDGSQDWESKALLNTRDGDMVVVSGRGTGRMANPTTGTWQGELAFMTQSPKLAYLNNTKGWIEGSGDMAKGTYQGKVYAKK
jgi:hypothetical protein